VIERLTRGYDRAEQFVTDLKIMAATLVEIAAYRFRESKPSEYHKLTCRHCGRSIRRAPWANDYDRCRRMYQALDGSTTCDGTIRTKHEPTLG
jgi:hypothetical protein